MVMFDKQLKDYKGFSIYKSWIECNGIKCQIMYDAYLKDNYFDSKNNLKNLKKSIDNYVTI